ncbi:MAG TPA: DUF5309 family protein [Acidimicrobiales bacterium]|nr:DUF5309 family protein [Acidimicrobiales bacterium]
MGAVTGQGTTFNLPNYVGELFFVTPKETPFLSMIGGLTGGIPATATEIQWQSIDNAAAAQPAILEGADPVYNARTRSPISNILQIFQYGVELSYTKQGAVGQISGASILGTQPVQNERVTQRRLKLEQAARDMDYSFLQGAYQKPVDNTTARKTRGMKNAVTTNVVAAAGARLNRDHFQSLFKSMADSGAIFSELILFANAFSRQRISDIYAYAPESRNVGGFSINQIETDFGMVGVCFERHQPVDEVLAAEMSVIKPRFLTIPEKGHMFFEPLAKTGAADKEQLYGEAGLEYGPEQWHGKITGLATA